MCSHECAYCNSIQHHQEDMLIHIIKLIKIQDQKIEAITDNQINIAQILEKYMEK